MHPDSVRRRFEAGNTFEHFQQNTERGRKRLDHLYDAIDIPDETAGTFGDLVDRHGGQVYVMALAEPWCGDALRGLPLLARLSEAVPGMTLRILPSDAEQNQDLVKRWPKGERNPIPILVFFDPNFGEIGHWIERADTVQTFYDALREKYKDLEDRDFFRTAGPELFEAFEHTLWRDTLLEWRDVLRVKDPQTV